MRVERCFCCGELPKVGSFPLMTGRTGWTCLCRCHETNTYYDKEDAIAEWNEWVSHPTSKDGGLQ